MKRLLSFIMAFAMVLTMLPMAALAADSDTTVYLVPNANWKSGNARFAMYYWNGSGSAWTDVTDTDGDGYYEAVVPAGYTNIIFCRMNPSNATNSWDNKWNQTADLTLPTDGTNCYTVAEGTWDNGGGTWSTYTPKVEEEETTAPTESEEETVTVYFRNDWQWPEVYVHYWNDSQGTEWPGELMTFVENDAENRGIYTAEIPAWATGLLFNGLEENNASNRQQTPNITDFTDGDAYYIHWDGENKVSKFDYTPSSGEEETDPDEPAATDYYLVGYINGADYSGEDYKFVDGELTVNLANASYVMVKTATNSYMTDGWQGTEITSVTLHNTDNVNTGDKLYVPAGEVTFTLSVNENDTLTLSYAVASTGEELTDPVTAVTIHYRNTGMWSDVYYHAWIENGDNDTGLTTWPGTALTENDEHPNWYTVELSELDKNAGIGILFNNNSGGQTGDIMITANGEYWYDGQLLTEAPADTWPDGSVATVTYEVTLHFANTKNWGSVSLYTWNAAGTPTGSWPGTTCGLGSDGFYSLRFTYEAPEGQGLNFIFSGSGQTVDLALDASAFVDNKAEKWVVPTTTNDEGKYYADIVDNPEAIAISPVVNGTSVTFEYAGSTTDTVQVYGSMNSWASGYAMTCNEYGVFSVNLENVGYGIHQYKFVVNGNWILDPINSFVITEDSGNQNSAFLISNPELDTNTVKINVHYDAPSAEWNVCAWGATGLDPQYNFSDGVATITLDGRANQYVAFKVRKSIEGNDWAAQSGEIRVGLGNIVSGTIDVYVGSDFSVSQSLNDDVVYANKISSVEYDYDNNTITVQTSQAVNDAETAFAIYKDGADAGIIESVSASGSAYTLTLTETLDLVTLYQYTVLFKEDTYAVEENLTQKIGINTVYASEKFGNEFTYTGTDLGANWTADSTTFVVWAPTAASVKVNLYESGTEGSDDLIDSVLMTKGTKGEWTVTVDGNLNGTYYTYAVTVDGETVEAVDPYARTTGVNGKRGMVIDLDSTDPDGWDKDTNPNKITSYTDAIIYELHVRDFSIDDSSGMTNKGKYLAFTEKGTTTAGGVTTGIDYLEDLGVNYVHLLPVYDYGSVDETKCDTFNWGYDPVNYNTPEGSYSTDPYNGATRVNEFKQMVMALHDAGISVIMDVVYNHVYDAGKFCMNQIVPTYFSRVNADGSYSNGSGCGNDTASEREMVRKYIVESVLYWHQEYHIDGFRFDLVGLLDATTINEIVEEVHACCPEVIFYGEGWTLGTAVEPGNTMATQANAAATPDFAYFSDTIRNLLAGSNGSSLGFVSGATGQEEAVANNFMAMPWWTSDPSQIIQYASCHDNYTLIDKLILSTGKSGIDADIIKMNNLAAAIYMTSQGVPFIHAAEEFLREKLEEDGSRCENSYNASDYVNHIEWSNLENETYAANSAYYKGLIAFRKAHEALRMESNEKITANIDYTWVTNEVVKFTIDGKAAGDISDSIVVIFNATKNTQTVSLPEGEWSVCINATQAGIETLATVNGSVSVDGISAMVLVQGENDPECEHEWKDGVCAECGENCGHDWQNGTCSVCGSSKELVAYLAGSMNDWITSANAMTSIGGTKVATTVSLTAGTHEFKIVYEGSWYGNSGTIDGSDSGWVMDSDANCKLKAKYDGMYTFVYDTAENKLDVYNKITETLYLRGSFNDWGTTNALSGTGTDVQTATVTLDAGTYEFKVANNGWTFSTSADNISVTLEHKSALTVTATYNGDGTWTVSSDVETVCVAHNDHDCYENVADALDAAAENGGTVALMNDCAANTVLVKDGVTLDLNGHTLTADYVTSFGGDVIDSTRTGLLVVNEKNLILDSSNKYVPVWTGEGYTFTQLAIVDNEQGMGLTMSEDGDKAIVKFVTFFRDTDLLTDGVTDNNLSVVIRVSWTTSEGTANQDFVYNDEHVGTVVSANGRQAFKLTFTGCAGLENLTFTPMVLSGTHAEFSGTMHSQN